MVDLSLWLLFSFEETTLNKKQTFKQVFRDQNGADLKKKKNDSGWLTAQKEHPSLLEVTLEWAWMINWGHLHLELWS